MQKKMILDGNLKMQKEVKYNSAGVRPGKDKIVFKDDVIENLRTN